MDPLTHFRTSHNLTALAAELFSRGQYLAAGELVWGAIVNAASAADPDHEIQPSDRFGNTHQAPNTNATFASAVRRIGERPLSENQISFCLNIGQQLTRTHFPQIVIASAAWQSRCRRSRRSVSEIATSLRSSR